FEIITDAIVVDKTDTGEQDQRISLYTKDFGKVVAKTTSTRKILSKLAAHVEPLNLVSARLVSRGDGFDMRGFQLVDALSFDAAAAVKRDPQVLIQAVKVFECVFQSIPAGVPDEELWDFFQAIRTGRSMASLDTALHALGLNAQFARCQICDRVQPEYFVAGKNFFLCTACRSAARIDHAQDMAFHYKIA
ncbi:MAG: recombination protein O N-terminal domain-containing protein, partial [Patescibacteria group bacterium]|nr:recombination protein O N-terminal domain-containing protein [Patescibacteria group bacterium]